MSASCLLHQILDLIIVTAAWLGGGVAAQGGGVQLNILNDKI